MHFIEQGPSRLDVKKRFFEAITIQAMRSGRDIQAS
jgi:hypothetical protein